MSDAAPSAATLSGDATLTLPEFDEPPADPMALARRWLDDAVRRQVREPYAAVLATADQDGRPSTRVLLVKELDDQGLVFTSSRDSRKGRELTARPWASMTFYWRETLQQLTIAGPVRTLPDDETDRLFADRPLAAQATSAASRQSHPLPHEQALRDRARALLAAGGPVPRPETWTAYRLLPENVELWYGSPDRLHRRLRYDRTGQHTADWTSQRLQP
jgi:pyridoxamine-phosphate oxidase